MFQTREWSRLIELRGPAEVVQNRVCRVCQFGFVAIGTSGFYDALALVCPCGDVYFKCLYDDSPTLACRCGGKYVANCAGCGSPDSVVVSEFSPYEYSASHQYVRGPGA